LLYLVVDFTDEVESDSRDVINQLLLSLSTDYVADLPLCNETLLLPCQGGLVHLLLTILPPFHVLFQTLDLEVF
jgi:hypothetical protein